MPPSLRVADGVVDQVAEHALEQVRVARHDLAAGLEAQAQAQLFGLAGAVHVQHAEQVADGEGLQVGLDHAGIELGDVEHGGERLLQRVDGADHVASPAAAAGVSARRFSSVAVNRPSACIGWRRSWLADGEEAALLAVGPLHQQHLLAQRAHQRVVVELGLQLFHQQAVARMGEEETGQQKGRRQRRRWRASARCRGSSMQPMSGSSSGSSHSTMAQRCARGRCAPAAASASSDQHQGHGGTSAGQPSRKQGASPQLTADSSSTTR